MEGWSLPPEPARHLHRARTGAGRGARSRGADGALHPRRPLAQLPGEVRRGEPHAQEDGGALRLCRDAGDPPEARRAIGRAQCNDAYWHGVFGGLYLPHLRDHIWYELAGAEAILREGQPVAWESRDIDCDGYEELWIHDETFSAIISPARGGVIEEYTVFEHRINYANTLTRRREAYHEPSPDHAQRDE